MTSTDVGPEAAGRPRVSLEEIEAEIRRGGALKGAAAVERIRDAASSPPTLLVVEAKARLPVTPAAPRTVEDELREIHALADQLCGGVLLLEERIGSPSAPVLANAGVGELVSLLGRLAGIRDTLSDVRARLDACMAALG